MCPFGKLMCMTKKNKTMKIKQLSYLLLGAALCGCTTDTTEEAGTKKTDADFIVRATVGDDGQTRADMTEDGLRFSFSAEDADRIGLYLNYPANDWTDQNLCFEAVNSQTKGWVDFKQVSSSTFAIQEGLNVYAYYPYEENEAQVSGTTDGTADSRAAVSSNWAGTRNLEVPAEQQQVAGDDFSNLAKYYVLAAVPTTVVNDTDNTPTVKLSFSGIFALLRIRLVNDTDNDVTIGRVDFEAARNQPLTGLYTADLTANPQFGNTDYKTTAVAGRTDNKVSVTLAAPATIAAGGDTYIYAVVHPLVVSYCVITAWTTDGYKFVERKTFNDNTTVSLQRDIRRTFRCTMSDSNKLPVDAPSQDAEGYYEIDSYEDMLWVSENATDAAKKYKMTQDIDMTGKIYTPIGFGTNYTEGAKAQEFAGEFDGGGHTISNVTVNPSYHTCVGIFGATKSGAVIKNLKVANLTYESDLPSEKAGQRKWIGGLIGYALPGTTVSDVALTNISLTANGSKESASTSYRIGGVIGLMELGSAEVSLYKNITADGVTLTGGYALGGFAGTMQQNARIEECSVKNVTIRHKNQILYGETSYPATGGDVYASSYFAGDVNQGTIDITCSGELVGGTNSREDLDGLGSMYESTWDIQPYVGELCISTLTLNGEALSRKGEVAGRTGRNAGIARRRDRRDRRPRPDHRASSAGQLPHRAYARPRDEDNGLVQQAEQLLGSHGFGPRLHYGRLRPDPELRGGIPDHRRGRGARNRRRQTARKGLCQGGHPPRRRNVHLRQGRRRLHRHARLPHPLGNLRIRRPDTRRDAPFRQGQAQPGFGSRPRLHQRAGTGAGLPGHQTRRGRHGARQQSLLFFDGHDAAVEIQERLRRLRLFEIIRASRREKPKKI